MNEHTKHQPWPMQVLFTALVYLSLAIAVSVTSWVLVVFTRWAFL